MRKSQAKQKNHLGELAEALGLRSPRQDWKTVLDRISEDEVKRTGRDLTLVVVYLQGPAKGLGRYFSNVRAGQKPRTTMVDPGDKSQSSNERELQNVFAAYATVSC